MTGKELTDGPDKRRTDGEVLFAIVLLRDGEI